MKLIVIAFSLAHYCKFFGLQVKGLKLESSWKTPDAHIQFHTTGYSNLVKRAKMSQIQSTTGSSNSVEIYSPVRHTHQIYHDAYYEPFTSHHDPSRFTPPLSTSIPNQSQHQSKPVEKIEAEGGEEGEVTSKRKRKSTPSREELAPKEKVSRVLPSIRS